MNSTGWWLAQVAMLAMSAYFLWRAVPPWVRVAVLPTKGGMVAFSPDGDQLLVEHRDRPVTRPDPETGNKYTGYLSLVTIWDAGTLKKLCEYEVECVMTPFPETAVFWSDEQLATDVPEWIVQSAGLRRWEHAPVCVSSPDGVHHIILSDLQPAEVYNGTRRVSTHLRGHVTAPTGAAFSPCRDILATVSESDCEVSVYRRHRPEQWWGVLLLPELWLAVVLVAVIVWSAIRNAAMA
jgi:WD40 repeat protein